MIACDEDAGIEETQTNDTGYSSLMEHPQNTATETPPVQDCKIMPFLRSAIPQEKELLENYCKRWKSKFCHPEDQFAHDRYKDVETQVMQKVLKVKSELRQTIRGWEIEFFQEHEREPMHSDFEENNMMDNYRRYNLCKKILIKFGISL